MPRPDAVKIPLALVRHKGADGERKALVVELAEDALEIDLDSTEIAWARDQEGFFFATRDPEALLFFPHGHPRQGQSRYEWTARADKIETGVLVDG